MLSTFIKSFSSLRTDKNRNRYPAFTTHRAPHKPLLLLSAMDLIAQGQITSSFVEPSLELLETFNTYYARIMPPGSATSMAHPFSRLSTDGFWERLPRPGYDAKTQYNVSSMKRLREVYYGARLEEALFRLLCDPESRERLRAVLIESYFAPEVHPVLLEQGQVNYEAYEYSRLLVTDPEAGYREESKEKNGRARDQGFRKAIVSLYRHRCALCGIRMLTPEGHTVVEAAHIVPWSRTHDDRPANGMALCRLCHWYFDEGLMGVGKTYEVLVSRRVQVEANLPGHMLSLNERRIVTPEQEVFWPAQANLAVHRKECYRV
jgi:putative restriction endonuclease